MMTIPTTIAVSSQNWNGKSWTRRSVAGSNRYDPAGKKTSWKSSNSRSKATSPTIPTTTTPIVSPIAPPRTARHVPARSDRRLAARRTTTEIAARIQRPRNTVRTSAMWACSRWLRTGVPLTWTSKLPPRTRSARIASVDVRSSSAVKPVQAAACARPCSKATHCGVRNGRTASVTMTIAVASPMRMDAARPLAVFTGSS